MIHDTEFDLQWADEPPGWVFYVGSLIEVWGNPVFQRRYVRWRLRPALGARRAFIVGIVMSFLLNLFIIMMADIGDRLSIGFFATVAIPMIIIVTLGSIRFFVSCLIGTMNELRRELHGDMLGALLATPVDDAKVFFSECIAGIMRGLGAIEEILAMAAGLIIPFLILHSPLLMIRVAELGILSLWWFVFIIMMMIILGMLLLNLTYASAAYAIKLPIGWALPAVIMHILLTIAAGLYIGGIIIAALLQFEIFQSVHYLVLLLIAALIDLLLLWINNLSMGIYGVRTLANARRPGYYEPDRMTAAGMLKVQGRKPVSFGQRI